MALRRGVALAVFALLILSASVGAQQDGVTEIVRQAPDKIAAFEDLARKISRQSPDRWKGFEDLARALGENSRRGMQEKGLPAVQRMMPPGHKKFSLPELASPKGPRLLLFLTWGPDPEGRLAQNRQTLQEVDPKTVVVLRGLPHGKRGLDGMFRYIHLVLGEHRDRQDKTPQLIMDPRLYRKYRVEVSPTLVYERDGQAVAWVRGLVDDRWLKDQVEKEGRTGDLGKYGPTEAVVERDFLEEIQERIASIDWKAKKEQAWQRYWTHYSFLTLPPAPRDRVYQVDAVYEVPQDFILPDGKVLARKGEKINLFEKVPPHFVLVVFDAGDPRQLAWAKKAGREYQKRFQVQYLTTSLPERTWECFERLEKALDEPLYLLNETVWERFHLAHVPSLVRPLEDRFEVREVKMGKDQGEKDVAQVSHR